MKQMRRLPLTRTNVAEEEKDEMTEWGGGRGVCGGEKEEATAGACTASKTRPRCNRTDRVNAARRLRCTVEKRGRRATASTAATTARL